MKERKISEAVIRRLPQYYRQLEELKETGNERISSSGLASIMGLNASQVRQDLNCFGGFGQQGYGYHVDTLFNEMAGILGINRLYKSIIVGAGNIGRALTGYEGFVQKGFKMEAIFDVDESIIGTKLGGVDVLHVDDMASFIKDNGIDIGIIAVGREKAREIANTMVESGIRGIWNFAPVSISVPIPIENVQLSDSLFVLSFRLQNR